MSPDAGLLQDMLLEAQLAQKFVSGMTVEEFEQDIKTQHAVIRSLEIIGEAANRVSTPTREQLPAVPWMEIIAQRHIAIHHYRKLQMPRIWTTVRDHLPRLASVLELHLKEQS